MLVRTIKLGMGAIALLATFSGTSLAATEYQLYKEAVIQNIEYSGDLTRGVIAEVNFTVTLEKGQTVTRAMYVAEKKVNGRRVADADLRNHLENATRNKETRTLIISEKEGSYRIQGVLFDDTALIAE